MVQRLLPGLVLVFAGLGAAGLYAERTLNSPGPSDIPTVEAIPHGGIGEIADLLVRDGIAARRFNFRVAAFLTRGDGPIRAGELAFPAHASLRDVLAVLRAGKPVQHSLTIPEGRTARQIAAILGRSDLLTGPLDLDHEAALLPQTYLFERGTPASAILARGRAALQKALDQEWAARAESLPLGSRSEALILASIVERETALAEERPRIAAVFLNRLRAGMKLQSDPTVIYAASAGLGMLDRPISRADLERDDPFNTYRIRGLPPGPIAAPGIASLHAVLHPVAGDELYFVADGNGGHAFARTLDEHVRNVSRYRALSAGR